MKFLSFSGRSLPMQLFELAEVEQAIRVSRCQYGMSSCISRNNGRVLILNVGCHHAIEIESPNSSIVASVSLGIFGKPILPDVGLPKVFRLVERKVVQAVSGLSIYKHDRGAVRMTIFRLS